MLKLENIHLTFNPGTVGTQNGDEIALFQV